MALKVGELVQILKVDNDPHKRGLRQARRDSEREGERGGAGYVAGFRKKLLPGLLGLARMSLIAFGGAMAIGAVQVGAKFAGAFLAKTASLVGPGLAAIALLIPAVIGAAALAVGTLKLALSGVGDALKAGLSGDTAAFAEALKGLSPAAQAVVKDLAGLKGAFDFLKISVQESFFVHITNQIRPLITSYLPILRTHMMSIADAFGLASARTAVWLRSAQATGSLDAAFAAMAEAIGNVAAGLPGIVAGLIPLIAVGASFLPNLTGGFSDLTDRFADFMHQAQQSGALHDFISGGLSGIGDLIQIFGELGAIVHIVLGAAIDAGLLDALQTLGAAVRQLVTAAGPGLKDLIGGLVAGLTALAPAAGPVGRALGAVMTAVAPLLPMLGNLATVVLVALAYALQGAAVWLGPMIGQFGDLASRVLPMLLPLLATMAQAYLPILAEAGLSLAKAFAPAIPILLQLAKTMIEQLLPHIPMLADVLATQLLPAFVEFNKSGMQALIALLRLLIPQIPILVQMFVFVVGAVAVTISIFARLTGMVGAVLAGFRAASGAVANFGAVMSTMASLVIGTFSAAGSWLYDAGKRILQGLINGVRDKIGELKGLLNSVTNLIPDWKGPRDRDKRLLIPAGQAMIGGLMGGIRMRLPDLRGMLGDVTTMIGSSQPAPAFAGAPGRPQVHLSAHVEIGGRVVEDATVRVIERRPELIANANTNGSRSLARRG